MKIIVNAHKCEIDKSPVNELEINITKCEFEFADEITSEFVKEAYFTLNHGETYKQIIVDNECDIPGEVLEKKGDVTIGVVAYLVENENIIKRYNPRPAYFNTWDGSLRDAENSQPITPSEMEQYEQALQDGLSEVNQKLVDIDEAIEDVNEAITETNNLNLDVNKQGKVATVTLTKKDASTKVVTLSDGTSLMFNWDGTKLGIKTDEDAEYTYVDLQGIQGPIGPKGEAFTIKKTYSSVAEMNADFNNMQLGDYVMIASTVEVEDNAKLYTRGESQWIFISDFSGATGIRGETGLTPNIQIGTVVSGEMPNVTRTGTNENPVLNFTLVKGDKGDTGSQGIQGETGVGIVSITKTSTEGLVDTYTITYTDGTTSTFQVTNGEDGETPLSDFNALKDRVSDVEDNQLHDDKEGTEIYIDDAHDSRVDRLELEKESSQETTRGVQLFDKIHSNVLDVYIHGSENTIYNASTLNRKLIYIQCEANANYTITKLTGTYFRVASTSEIPARGVNTINKIVNDSGNVITINSGNNANYLAVNFYNDDTDTLTEQQMLDSIMIEEGTEATSYEPYTGGQPSPNPDYPQEVKTVKGYRNLLDLQNGTTTNEVIATISNGEIILNGTTTAVRFITIGLENNLNLIDGNQYTISANNSIANSNIRIRIDSGGNYDDILSDINSIKTITYSSNTSYFNDRIQIRIASGVTLNNFKIKPQIVEGDQELPYVPYGNNYVDVKIINKNLLNKNKFTNTYINSSGVETTDTKNAAFDFIPASSNQTYTFSANSSLYRINIVEYDENQNFIQITFGRETNINTMTTTANTRYIRATINYNNSTTVTSSIIDTLDLQIEQGSQATEYEVFKETITPIPLNNNEIVGIGDYKDELLVDRAGRVYLSKNTRKLELAISNMNNGTNYPGWTNQTQMKSDYPNVTGAALNNYTNYICNIGTTGIQINTTGNGIIYLSKTVYELTQDEWIENYPNLVFILYYGLQEPELIDLNTTVDLKLFKEVNNITNSEDANMRIRYVQDTQLLFNNFDERLKALEQGQSL